MGVARFGESTRSKNRPKHSDHGDARKGEPPQPPRLGTAGKRSTKRGHALFGVPVIEADDVHAPGLLVLGHLALVPVDGGVAEGRRKFSQGWINGASSSVRAAAKCHVPSKHPHSRKV